jgi:hypothetical protein
MIDISSVIAELEATVATQLELAGDDPAAEAAAVALMNALEPALRQAAFMIVEAAATEVGAQLPDGEVDVVLRDGSPHLVYRPVEGGAVSFSPDDLQARLTLRLPEALKADLEEAAGQLGDSLNAYVVKTLSGRRRRGRTGTRMSGTIET